MESSNLTPSNPPPGDDAALAAFLRRSSPPLADAGFTAHVLSALPPPRRARLPLRPSLAAGAAIIGTWLAWRQIAAAGGQTAVARELATAVDDLSRTAHQAVSQADPNALLAALSLAIGVSVLSLLYTFRDEVSRRWPVWLRV